MTTSLFNAWKVLDRILTSDRERTAIDTAEYDRLQDRSLDSLQRQVNELREKVTALEARYGEGRMP